MTITVGLAMVTTVSAARSQNAAVSSEPRVRSLSWFEFLNVPEIPSVGAAAAGAPASRLTRELREGLFLQSQSRMPERYPLPFYWTLVDAVDSIGTRTLVATAHPDPVRRSGVVVEFADTDGNAIAAIQSASITAALKVLNELSGRTTVVGRARATAARPVGSFPIMHLSYRSPVGAGDEFNLLARLASALRRNGPWTLVDSMPVEGDPRRAQTVQCVLWHARGTLPTSVILRSEVPLLGATAGLFPFDPDRAELVLFLQSSSCRGCLGTDVVFTSAKTRADAATDRLARELLEHVELERQIYLPQRADRSR